MAPHSKSAFTLQSVAVGVTAALSFGLLASCKRAPDATFELVSQQRLEVLAGQSNPTALRLAAGAYSVRILELGVDVTATLSTPDGTRSTREPTAGRGVHVFHFELARTTDAALTLAHVADSAKRGSVDVEIRRWKRLPGAALTERESGDAAFADALTVPLAEDDDETLQAITHLERAALHYDAAAAANDGAAARLALATLQYDQLGAWLDAESNATAAERAFERARDPAAAASARVIAAAAQLERANEISSPQDKATRTQLLQTADAALEQSVEQLSNLNEAAAMANAVNLRGIGRWYARDFDAAREYFVAAIRTADQIESTPFKKKVLSNLAWLDFVSGRPRDAATEYQALLEIIDPAEDADGYAAIASNYALVLSTLGDFDAAITLHANVLNSAIAGRDESQRLQQLVAIASLRLAQGDAQRALEVARTALDMPNGLKERSKHNSALRVAGQAALKLRDADVARGYFDKLLDRSMSTRETAQARVFLAQTHRALGAYRDAEAQLELALAEDDEWLRAQALTERAILHLTRGDAAAAVRDLRVADAAFERIGLDAPRIETGTLLARAYTQMGDSARALGAADEAISRVVAIRARSSVVEARASFLASQYAPYEAKVEALLSQPRNGNSEQRFWAAIAVAESARAQSLAELRRNAHGPRPTLPSEELRVRDTLLAQRLLLERRLQRTASSDPSVIQIRREIAEAEARLSALAATQPATVASGTVRADDGQRVRESLARLPENVAVAYFFVGAERSHFWLIHSGTISHRVLGGRRELERSVGEFLGVDGQNERATSGTRAVPAALAAIGDELAASGAERIAILADGPLNGLPFAALPVGKPPNLAYLVERASIGYLPSLTGDHVPGTASASASRVAVISDPVYAIDDIRLASAGPAASRLRSAANDDLTRLPYSAAEAREIKRLYPPDTVIDLSGFQATAAAIEQLPFQDLAVLHFAGHAIARDDDPASSALHLSSYNNRRTPLENSSVTAENVLRLGMRANLVVLSGCSTAGGAPIAGEGMLGLTHSFLANGSRSVVASLWPVDDAQTARLMGQFHAAYRDGATAEEALAIAQRAALLADRDSGLTHNWSSFIVISADLVKKDAKANRGVSK
jgi:CHAT domain-containing protein